MGVVLRGLIHYRRSHLAVLLGVMVTTMTLVGSLLVGDVVRLSLRRLADRRLGQVEAAVISHGRLYTDDLAQRVLEAMDPDQRPRAAAVMQLPAVANLPTGEGRINVDILGVTPEFWQFSRGTPPTDTDGLVLSRRSAEALGLDDPLGSEVIIGIHKPSWLGGDVLMSSDDRSDTMMRLVLPVTAVVDDDQMGIFGLAANQVASLNVFVPLRLLQEQDDDLHRRCNLFLFAPGEGVLDAQAVNAALAAVWRPDDVGMELRPIPGGGVELRSRRIFLADHGEVEPLADRGHEIMTYLVTDLAAGDRVAVYSMVSAVTPDLFAASGDDPAPADWADDEVLINQWLADHLQIGVGDRLSIAYWTMGPMRRLDEHRQDFTVRAIRPMTGLAADPTMMPAFPGIEGSASCAEFDANLPIDFSRISDADEAYWMAHEGSPKAFVTLAAGRELWRNRFGATTQLRFLGEDDDQARIADLIRERVDPRSLGLQVVDVRGQGMMAAGGGVDLGEYFIGMSFFLIVAALLLTALLFAFAMDRRRSSYGLLLAIGFPHARCRRIFLAEAAIIASIGVVVGAGLGIGYTWLLTRWISGGIWQAAVGGVELEFAITPGRLIIGAVVVWLLALGVLWSSLYRMRHSQAVHLLRQQLHAGAEHRRPAAWLLGAGLALVVAALVLALAFSPDPSAAPRFFGAGALLLVGGILLVVWGLRQLGARPPRDQRGLASLALANATRAPGRSLTIVAVLASACFLILAVGAMYRDASFNAWDRSAGTGGFAFMGETNLPVLHDLGSAAGQRHHGITERIFAAWWRQQGAEDRPDGGAGDLLAGLAWVPMRATDGDDASCLNLNRSTQPRLWGLDPEALAEREAFSFHRSIDPVQTTAEHWRLLHQRRRVEVVIDGERQEVEAVPAIAETAAATYAMALGLGDVLIYDDESGGRMVVQLVATLADAMLQGGLLIAEEHFVHHFPSHNGYQAFLVDSVHRDAQTLALLRRFLETRLQSHGLRLDPADERLRRLFAMQNVYLGIFQILGALGLLLGSLGLGVVLLRNVLERHRELALMQALGFARRRLVWMLILEHSGLLAAGIGLGLVAALIAILPIVLAPGQPMAVGMIAALLALVVVVGVLTIVLAGRRAMGRGVVMDLRSE